MAVRRAQFQMQTKGVDQGGHQGCGNPSESAADPLDRHGSHLVGLRLRVHPEAGLGRAQRHLEREDPAGLAGDGDHGDDAATQSLGHDIRVIVAHDDGRTALVGLRSLHRFEVDESDLTPAHHQARRR